jgi:hypothetical protein
MATKQAILLGRKLQGKKEQLYDVVTRFIPTPHDIYAGEVIHALIRAAIRVGVNRGRKHKGDRS